MGTKKKATKKVAKRNSRPVNKINENNRRLEIILFMIKKLIREKEEEVVEKELGKILCDMKIVTSSDFLDKIVSLFEKIKFGGRVTVVTHNGIFHADEIIACIMIKLVFGEENVSILRTRDEKKFADADFVVDVGRKYDGVKFFDHHQRIDESRPNGWPFASAGLVLRYFWPLFLVEETNDYENFKTNLMLGYDIYNMLDENLVRHIDATDSGFIPESKAVSAWKAIGQNIVSPAISEKKLKRKFSGFIKKNGKENLFLSVIKATLEEYSNAVLKRVTEFLGKNSRSATGYSISSAITSFNSVWNEPNADNNRQFASASVFSRTFFESEIKRIRSNTLADKKVHELILKNKHKGFIVLEKYIPWGNTEVINSKLLYVVYPDPGMERQWDIRCIPKEIRGFNAKKPLPASWGEAGGKEGREALITETGISDVVFCHKDCWIAGFGSKESAIKAARIALMAP